VSLVSSFVVPVAYFFIDIIPDILGVMNETWERSASVSLQRYCRFTACFPIAQSAPSCDVILRWHRNRNVLPDSINGTVGNFFDLHNSNEGKEIFFGQIPQRWKSLPGEKVCLELHVDGLGVSVICFNN
jgi:hypothetical protein